MPITSARLYGSNPDKSANYVNWDKTRFFPFLPIANGTVPFRNNQKE
jgi:hypothetical protein